MLERGVGIGAAGLQEFGGRIVDVVQGLIGVGAGEASADGMHLAVDHDQGDVVARLRQRRRRGPYSGRRVEDLMGGDRDAVGAAPADHMQLAAERDGGRRAARARQRRQRAPAVGLEIVFERHVDRGAVGRRGEAAERVDLVVSAGERDVMGAARHGRELTPVVGCGIVHLVAADLGVLIGGAADGVDLAVDRDHAKVLARRRHRGFVATRCRPDRRL